MKNDRALTAQLLTDAGMMPVVKEFAARFGNQGRLPGVAVITPDGSAYYGQKPVKTQRVAALPRSQKRVS